MPDPSRQTAPAADPMPVFPIKAQDQFALDTIAYYRHLCQRYGQTRQAEQVDLALAEAEAWRFRNHHLVKMPDHEHVPAAAQVSSGPVLTDEQAGAVAKLLQAVLSDLAWITAAYNITDVPAVRQAIERLTAAHNLPAGTG